MYTSIMTTKTEAVKGNGEKGFAATSKYLVFKKGLRYMSLETTWFGRTQDWCDLTVQHLRRLAIESVAGASVVEENKQIIWSLPDKTGLQHLESALFEDTMNLSDLAAAGKPTNGDDLKIYTLVGIAKKGQIKNGAKSFVVSNKFMLFNDGIKDMVATVEWYGPDATFQDNTINVLRELNISNTGVSCFLPENNQLVWSLASKNALVATEKQVFANCLQMNVLAAEAEAKAKV